MIRQTTRRAVADNI